MDMICRGRHHRFVVDVKTTEARLAAKAQKAGIAMSARRNALVACRRTAISVSLDPIC